MHIALCGPCDPRRLSDLLDPGATSGLQLPELGGTSVVELARALIVAGHLVTVVTIADEDYVTIPFDLCGPQLRFLVLPQRGRARDYLLDQYARERRSIASAIQAVDADIVHVHWTYEYELGAQDAGLVHVTTARDAPSLVLRHERNAYRALRLAVALRARPGIRHLSTVSPHMARVWRRHMAYRRPIRVIPNMVPADFRHLVRQPARHPVVLEVANSSHLKNVPTLLRAFAQVRQQVPDAELRLVGEGLQAMSPMAYWARAQGLDAGVGFLGSMSREDLAGEYCAAWLLAHASLEESFGNVLIEALSAGVPVVGGLRSGAVPYVLGEGAFGGLVDVRSPREFAAAIRDGLVGGPQAVPPGVGTFLRQFSSTAVAEHYLAWYRAVLDGGPGV